MSIVCIVYEYSVYLHSVWCMSVCSAYFTCAPQAVRAYYTRTSICTSTSPAFSFKYPKSNHVCMFQPRYPMESPSGGLRLSMGIGHVYPLALITIGWEGVRALQKNSRVRSHETHRHFSARCEAKVFRVVCCSLRYDLVHLGSSCLGRPRQICLCTRFNTVCGSHKANRYKHGATLGGSHERTDATTGRTVNLLKAILARAARADNPRLRGALCCKCLGSPSGGKKEPGATCFRYRKQPTKTRHRPAEQSLPPLLLLQCPQGVGAQLTT
jgi:hypothetical protein